MEFVGVFSSYLHIKYLKLYIYWVALRDCGNLWACLLAICIANPTFISIVHLLELCTFGGIIYIYWDYENPNMRIWICLDICLASLYLYLDYRMIWTVLVYFVPKSAKSNYQVATMQTGYGKTREI